MTDNKASSKVGLANKLIERARKMNATCLLVSLAILFAVGASLDAEITSNPSDGLSLFGIKISFSSVSFFGPIAILCAQAVSMMYIAAMAKLFLSDKSLFGKISEPWMLLYPEATFWVWMLAGIISFFFPLLSLIFALFIGIDDGGKISFWSEVSPYDIVKLVISGAIAVRTGWFMWELSLTTDEILKSTQEQEN